MRRYRKRLKRRLQYRLKRQGLLVTKPKRPWTPGVKIENVTKPVRKELTEFEKRSIEIRESLASRKDEIEKRLERLDREEEEKQLRREDPVLRMRKVREAIENGNAKMAKGDDK
jgi:hypothetical protein